MGQVQERNYGKYTMIVIKTSYTKDLENKQEEFKSSCLFDGEGIISEIDPSAYRHQKASLTTMISKMVVH